MEFVKLIFMLTMMMASIAIFGELSTLGNAIKNHNYKIDDQNKLLKKIADSLDELSKK